MASWAKLTVSKVHGLILKYMFLLLFMDRSSVSWDLLLYSGTRVSMGNGFFTEHGYFFSVLIFYPILNPVKRILILKNIRRP